MLFIVLPSVLGLATAAIRPGCYLGDFICQVFIGYDGAACDHENNVCLTNYGSSMIPCATTEASPVSTTEASPVSTTEASPVKTSAGITTSTDGMANFTTTVPPVGGADSIDDENAADMPYCDDFCIGLNSGKSYCKSWLIEPVCHGGDQSCGPASCIPNDTHAVESASCDNYCIKQNPTLAEDEVSYCKWWLSAPVCFNGDQPCPPSVCGSGESD
ncbi:hypothetical protein FOL47_010317 [Perkinsus chesapeaki]|uniref:Uncharacterized protein n=1 Tax=Perkinsus chesapeaki TaxID=330153 RepID=A0A7J6L3S7_PERCH|nr:hypothetical protein FOL47_010317 [Perkinsus chesapeaki]